MKHTFWCTALLCAVWLAGIAHADPAAPPTSRPTTTSPPLGRSQALSQGRVFIKLKRLRRLLRHRKRRSYNGVIPTQARYQGRLEKGWLKVEARLQLRRTSLGRRKRFALGGRGGIIYDVRLQGQPQAPRRDAWGTHWVQLPASLAPITVTYTYGLQVPAARGEHKLKLDLPRCPKATLQLQFKGKGWESHTKPASQVQLNELARGTQATLQLPGEGRIWLMWKGKRVERKEKTRFRANIETLLTLQEGLLQGQSQIHLEILTGSLRSVEFALPQEVEVLHAGGDGVVEWFQSGKAKGKRLYTIQLSRAIRKRHKLKLRFEQTRKRKTATVFLPQLAVQEAEQVSLFVGVLAKADTEVSHQQVTGGQQVDVRSLPNRIRRQSSRPILLAYRSAQATPSIHVKMVRHPHLKVMKTVINRARFETVRTRTGREVVKATYWVTNNRRQFMPVQLPQGATIIGAFVAGYPVQPAQQKKPSKRLSWGRVVSTGVHHYLLPLIRSSRKQSKRSFPVEILYTQKNQKLGKWGSFTSQLPATPIQILSYHWNFYIPQSHRRVWLAGTARHSLQGRFLKRLFYRLERDLRAGTPVLWAGGRRKLNVYNFKGLKERFAAPLASSDLRTQKISPGRYKSRFAKAQWQVRAKMPLVGRRLSLHGHLVRARAPQIRIWYIKDDLTKQWFWLVLFLTLIGGVLFLTGLFGKGPVRWGRVLLALLLWGGLFGVGYAIPMTYLAGFRGLLFGFWAAVLIGLAMTPEERLWVGSKYLRFARICAVAATFLMLLIGGVGTQVAVIILATPIYPALLRKRKQGGDA